MNNSFAAAALAIAASIGVFAIPATTMAAPVSENGVTSQSHAVSLQGIDLATPEGQRVLERRIRKAARDVCGIGDVTTGSRLRDPEANACYAQALRDARARVADIVAHKRAVG